MTNEASSNAIIGNILRIIASGEYHPGAELTQKMASYIIELEQKLTDMAVQLANAESKCRELAVENSGLKAAFDKPQAYLSWHAIPPTWEDPLPCGEYLDVHDDAGHKNSDGTDCWPVYAKPEIKTPVADAFLAEVLAQAHKEGAHFVANRMLAAWEAGFIEDTAKNAADIARMILTSTEFMPNAPQGDFDRSFADGVLEDIAAQLRKGAAL